VTGDDTYIHDPARGETDRKAESMSSETKNIPDALLERELAERWRVTSRTLQRWRKNGTGPVWQKLGGRVLYPLWSVEAHEQRCQHGQADEAAE